MADFSSLIDKMRTMFMPGNQLKQSGVSYGPSVTRIGRTPLGFTNQLAESSGRYMRDDLNKQGTIMVNPTSVDNADVGATIGHEDIHSILRNLSDDQLVALSKFNPYYRQVADVVGKTRGGFMPAEIPAYMGAYTKAFTPGVSPSLQKLYTDYFQSQLQRVDPNAASGYSRVRNMNYADNPMPLRSDASTLNSTINMLNQPRLVAPIPSSTQGK